MSLTLICPSCGCDTPSEHSFCISCNEQTRCLNEKCNKILLPGKEFCFGCGQLILKKAASQGQLNKYVRSIKQVGKSYEEHTELSVSDHAVSELAPFIATQITSQPPQRPHYISNQSNSTVPSQKIVPSTNLLPIVEEAHDAYYYLKEKFKTISVRTDSFSRAMSNSNNGNYFCRNGELYYITSEGQQIVEDWIDGKSLDSLIDVEDDEDDMDD